MHLFDLLPEELFSVLASKNRRVYLDALDVLWDLYQDRVKISHKSYWGGLLSRLESQLEAEQFQEEEMSQEERANAKGKASFLIRKLKQKGWIEQEHGQDYQIFYTLPDYSSQLLDLFHQMRVQSTPRGFSYVFGTYSALKTAQAEGSAWDKLQSIHLAHHNTSDLVKLLKAVFHNIKRYFKFQMDFQDSNQVLEMYYDDFAKNVLETYIRPLKVQESVPKYRDSIQRILLSWVEEEETFSLIIKASLAETPGLSYEDCGNQLKQKVYWVNDQYNSLQTELLDEIDLQVRRYHRASTQKIKQLTNRDYNLKGQLTYLLQALGERDDPTMVTEISGCFQLGSQKYFSDQSLYQRKKSSPQTMSQRLVVEEPAFSPQAEAELQQLLYSPYGKKGVSDYMEALFGEKQEISSQDFPLEEEKAYVMSFLSLLYQEDPQCFYQVTVLEGHYHSQGYTIPQMVFSRKKEEKS